MPSFRLRPRFRALPAVAAGVGVGVFLLSPETVFGAVCGIGGPLLGVGYLALPTWRLRVLVDDATLAVSRPGRPPRLVLRWDEVVRLIHAPASHTLYLDGGDAARSFLLPGPGAPGPYRVERSEALYDLIVARVPPDRRRSVPSLDAPEAKNV